jgi:2-keto-4-pentenoate hydratase/2-oxohepta-3-ene-1,7-dioic acid hydratase in catechol pathway
MYKLGPRNARPGKIKQTLPVVQGPVQKAEELKPVVEVSIGKFHKQSTIASQAGPSQPQIPLVHLNFTKSSDGDHVKPKPKPKPIKGKVSEGELGIVTRDRSKRIAQESVRSTRSKKLKTT